MRLTRWKLMAGVLGLSMCGLAALAEPACRSVGLTRRADDTKPTEAAKPLPLPVPAPPTTTEVPPPIIPAVDDKKAMPLPLPFPDAKPADAKPLVIPPINDPNAAPAVDPKLLADVHKIQNPPTPLPTLNEDLGKKLPTPAPITPAPLPVPAPIPAKESTPVPVSPAPIPGFTPVAAPQVIPVADSQPTAIPVTPLKEEVPLSKPKAEVPPVPAFASEVKPAIEPKPAGALSNKKLKVMLHLSDEKPWFEVKDGDELVLKVTADAVSLEAAVSGKTTSTLTASGAVTFRTLGGFGTCDELRVVPGTGEVVVTGKVAVTSNWGKAETTATADKMTFRLGGDAKK